MDSSLLPNSKPEMQIFADKCFKNHGYKKKIKDTFLLSPSTYDPHTVYIYLHVWISLNDQIKGPFSPVLLFPAIANLMPQEGPQVELEGPTRIETTVHVYDLRINASVNHCIF